MSKNQDNKTKELNEKNKETQNIFASLQQYKKKDKEIIDNIETDNIDDNVNNYTSEDNDINDSNNIYMSLLNSNDKKDEYLGTTHYFRKDQLNNIEKFSKKTKKHKSEFMRELMDLVFAELERGINENKQNNISKKEIINKSNISNNSISKDNRIAYSDNPFDSLLEANDPKEQYVRRTHYFREDQLEDLDKFVEKSGKSKNKFIRDAVDLVFNQLKKVSN